MSDIEPTSQAAPAPASQETATFLDPSKLVKTIPLQHPLVFRGVTYTEICLKRMTARDVSRTFEEFDAKKSADASARLFFPIYVDREGKVLPAELFEQLEADDFANIDDEAALFLPRRLRALATETTSTESSPANGSSGEPTS